MTVLAFREVTKRFRDGLAYLERCRGRSQGQSEAELLDPSRIVSLITA